MITRVMVVLTALLLCGCASLTRDRTIHFQCPELAANMHRIPFDLVPQRQWSANPGDLHAQGTDSGDATPSSALTEAMAAAQRRWTLNATLESDKNRRPPQPGVLLLSGGGQWGAFGAGFLRAVHGAGGDAMPPPAIVTGISTGAIQTLFVAAGDYDGLYAAYTAQPESAYARSRSTIGTLINGSRASFAPLRRLLTERLTGADGKPPLLQAIARNTHSRNDGTRPLSAFIGMVDAESGDFVEVDLAGLVQTVMPDPNGSVTEHAADCVTAVAMASSAIPVTFERVAIATAAPGDATTAATGGRVYYDGGVRQSVFLSAAASARREALRRTGPAPAAVTTERDDGGEGNPALPFFVIRNGPSTARDDPAIQTEHNIYDAAMRGYSLLVNQNEVMSVCALRLVNPDGPIKLQTADGYRDQPDMAAGPRRDTQFDVPFMHKLARLGQATGERATGRWLILHPLDPSSGEPLCRVSSGARG